MGGCAYRRRSLQKRTDVLPLTDPHLYYALPAPLLPCSSRGGELLPKPRCRAREREAAAASPSPSTSPGRARATRVPSSISNGEREIGEPQGRGHGGRQAGVGGGGGQHQPQGPEGHQEHPRRPSPAPSRQQEGLARKTSRCRCQEPAWRRRSPGNSPLSCSKRSLQTPRWHQLAARGTRNADTAFHAPSDLECSKASDDDLDEMMTNELKEIDMEDSEEEVAPDIDSCDVGNSLAVVEYVDEIYSFYRRTEELSCVSPTYMAHQSDISEKMRGILIDWLIEVHYKLELLGETLFLTVNIIDRYLARGNVARKKLQLVGVTAMLLACKYEEVSVPVVEDLILICDRVYSREDILDMERMIVDRLEFNMSVPTPYCFMRRFLKAAGSDKKLELLSFFLIELSLVDYKMLKFQPSMLAAAAIYTAQCTLHGCMSWNKCCELHTKYSEQQLMECSREYTAQHLYYVSTRLTMRGVNRADRVCGGELLCGDILS